MKKLVIIAITALLSASSTQAFTWSGNLLINPGAESATLTGWTTDALGIVVASHSQQSASGTVRPYSGDRFFNMAGISTGLRDALLYQNIDISEYAAEIDAGILKVQAGAFMQTEDVPSISGADYAQLTIYYFDSAGSTITSLTTGLSQSPNLTWIEKSLEGIAPTGTRSISFELFGERHEGTYINAFFDNTNLQIAVIPEPATLLLLGLGAIVLRRKS